MHETGVVELPHRCVYKRVPCFAVAPGFEEREGVFPANICIFRFEGLVHAGHIFFTGQIAKS